ncbi:MAG: response regulator [Deltaproteobacteria bacterium]|nr:response regulator [Candidatus Zymogenaceae bacterium]
MPTWEIGKIGDIAPITVLLIESDQSYARLIKEIISGISEKRGNIFELKQAESMEEGIVLLKNDTIDVVLLELQLPDSEGLFTFLKVHHAEPDVPVVVLSSLEDDETAVLAVKEGAQDYLYKAVVTPGVLVRSVRHAVERKRARDQYNRSMEEIEELLDKRTEQLVLTQQKLDRLEESQRRLSSELGKVLSEVRSMKKD